MRFANVKEQSLNISPQACHLLLTCMFFRMWIYRIFHDFRWRKNFSRFWILSVPISSQLFIVFSTLLTKGEDDRNQKHIFPRFHKTDRGTHGCWFGVLSRQMWLAKGANQQMILAFSAVLLCRLMLTWSNRQPEVWRSGSIMSSGINIC